MGRFPGPGGWPHGPRRMPQQTRRVDEEVSLPPRQLLCAIVAMRSSPVCGLHRLTINDASRRAGFASSLHAAAFPQGSHDVFPHSLIAKASKIRIHGRFGRVFPRDHAPGTTSSQYVKDPIEHRPHVNFSWSSTGLLRRDEWLEKSPLLIGEIRRIQFHWRPHLSWVDALYSPFLIYSIIVLPSFSSDAVHRLPKPSWTRSTASLSLQSHNDRQCYHEHITVRAMPEIGKGVSILGATRLPLRMVRACTTSLKRQLR